MAVSSRFGRLAAVAAVGAVFALPLSGYAQQRVAPQWVNDSWRSASYPQAEWFTGFSQDGVKSGASTAAALQRVEKDARTKLSENIVVRITSASRNEASSNRVTTGGYTREVVEKNYGQIILASTSSEVAKTELRSYHDTENNRVYAFAAVRKSTLAAYYAGMIESALADAERSLDLATQAAQLGKKKNAVEKLAESKRQVESTERYKYLLVAIDAANGLARAQGDRAGELMKRIAAAQAEAEDIMPVFVTGTETIYGTPADVIVPGLVAMMNDNDCRITESEKDAGYILKIDATAQNGKTDGYVHYSESSVRVTLTNTVTGKAEVTTTVAGPKKSGRDVYVAGEAAFKAVVPEIWKALKGKLAMN